MAAAPPQPGALRKDISLFGVFAIALGTTISSGFFLLPGMAFAEVGPAVIVSYLLAGLVVLPPLLCKAELATAMPRAGGVYFYVDRCFGPLAGTVAGVGTWMALTLKTSFALVGSGYYLGLFIPDPPVILIAVVLAVAFGTLNMFGAGKTTKLQAMLVVAMLVLLAWFVGWGASDIDASHFDGFWGKGGETVISMVGVVLISYMGLTKVVSVAEEIRNPERNIPAGILLALGTAVLIYMAGLAVMVGVVPAEELASTYTPAALAADFFAGRAGMITISVAAIASFLSVANAGILSASRYPLAMGRDHIFPKVFRRLSSFGTPVPAIFVTVTLIVVEVILLDPLVIAKYAGTLQLLLFATIGAAVIVMRESHLASYDPGFRVPLYPWVPLLGIALCITAIVLLGWVPVIFAVAMIVVSVVWFKLYAASKIDRYGAIFHVFARLGEHRFDPLDAELRGIIKDKGLRPDDPFEKTIARARVIEAPPGITFEELATLVSEALASDTGRSADHFHRGFLEGTQVGATPVMGSVALPHLRLAGLRRSHLVLVRCTNGMEITVGPEVPGSNSSQDVRALFFMASPEADPAQHLRLLANLAGAVEQDGFMARWNAAAGPGRTQGGTAAKRAQPDSYDRSRHAPRRLDRTVHRIAWTPGRHPRRLGVSRRRTHHSNGANRIRGR